MNRLVLALPFGLAACSYPALPQLGGGTDDARPPDAAPVTSCTPNEFVDCYISSARICNGAGNGVVEQDCGAPGCNMAAKRCNQCVAQEAFCSNKDLVQCGADGLPGATETCAVDCGTSPAPHCTHIVPSYTGLADVCDTGAPTATLHITANTTASSNDPVFCNGGFASQAFAPSICIVRAGTIKIDSGVTLTVTGGSALALVADHALTIDGALDISASYTTGGPGGSATASGGPPGAVGGGGAGYKTAGGAGGNATANGGAANGGAMATDPGTVTVLVGGNTPVNTTSGATGGGGGGAAALISCQGTVLISANATLSAGGGGGPGGYDTNMAAGATAFVSGWGGGTGGNIALQGVAVTALGKFFANGGSGGGSTTNDNQIGSLFNGADALNSTSAAQGGPSAGTGGAGGNGGTGTTAPGVGGKGPSGSAGGGGGSVGFFQTYTPSGVAPTVTPSAASPAFQPNRTVQIK